MGTDLIATYLNVNKYPTASRKGEWSASKVRRVLMNEKYAGLILYGKFKIVDPNTKKKIATHVEAVRETIVDQDGKIIQERNVVYGNWEPLVDEDVWWKAQDIRKERSAEFINSSNGALKTGKRSSNDSYANKAYCCCGYTMSPQYVHAATDDKPAQFRYKCRQQINAHTPEYRAKHGLPPSMCNCDLPAVSDVAMRLMSVKVFEFLFSDIRDSIDETIKIIELANEQALDKLSNGGVSVDDLKKELDKLMSRLDKYVDMYTDGDLSKEQYRSKKLSTENEIEHTKELIRVRELEISEKKKKKFDIEAIKTRLNTYVDLDGFGVSNEMIEFFVERIIHRAGNEFVWEMNLSGLPNVPNKYKISGFDETYSNSLQSDDDFNIVKTFVISLEECKEFCVNKAHRQFKPAYWSQITVKIAVK